MAMIFFAFMPIEVSSQNNKEPLWEAEADTLMDHQDFVGAVKLYSKIISESKLKSKDDYRPLYKRAVAYYSSADFENALRDINRFIPEFEQNHQAHILRALIYRQMGDNEKQLVDVEKALELRGGNVEVIKWRGSLLMEKREYQRAKSDFLLVKSIRDEAEVETNLGFVYYSLGSLDSALVYFNKSIALDVTYEPTYLYAGSFCLQEEQYQKALTYLNLALRLDPDNINAIFYKGIALVELKRETEGCSCLNKAFAAGQDDAADYLKQHCYDISK